MVGRRSAMLEEGDRAVSSSHVGKWLNTLGRLSKVKDTEI